MGQHVAGQTSEVPVNRMLQKSVKSALGGVLYGLGLTSIGFLMTGAGHGTYILLGLASAPLSFFGFFESLAGPPLLWGLVGGLLPYTRKYRYRQIFVSIMLLHYLAVLVIPFFEEYGDWKYLKRVWDRNPVVVIIGFTLYVVGQSAIWRFERKILTASDGD